MTPPDPQQVISDHDRAVLMALRMAHDGPAHREWARPADCGGDSVNDVRNRLAHLAGVGLADVRPRETRRHWSREYRITAAGRSALSDVPPPLPTSDEIKRLAYAFRDHTPMYRNKGVDDLIRWAEQQASGSGSIAAGERGQLRDIVRRINQAMHPRKHEQLAVMLLYRPMSTRDIRRHFNIGGDGVRLMVKKLRDAGWVRMRPGTGIGKTMAIWEMTPEGRAVAAAATADCAADKAVS